MKGRNQLLSSPGWETGLRKIHTMQCLKRATHMKLGKSLLEWTVRSWETTAMTSQKGSGRQTARGWQRL